MRCQSIANYSSQVCWFEASEFKRAVAAVEFRKRKKMTNSTDVSDVMNMTRFGQRFGRIRERHVESTMKPRLQADELTGMISLLRDKFVRSENLKRCCFVPMRRNSVFDGLRSILFKFIQERMSLKVVVSVSSDRTEFVGVRTMCSWMSSAYKLYLGNLLRSCSQYELKPIESEKCGPSTES